MGNVESQMLEYLNARLDAGALAVAAEEILDAVVPREHPELREKPAYRYGLDRLLRRGVINAVDKDGRRYYFIGNVPSLELLQMLELSPRKDPFGR